jgi:hypothetical protein
VHLGRPTNKNKQKVKVKVLDDKNMEVESNAAAGNMQTQNKSLTRWAYEAWHSGGLFELLLVLYIAYSASFHTAGAERG